MNHTIDDEFTDDTCTDDEVTGRAVVLGGSLAGLLSAAVLAEHVPDVRILDRDDLTASPAPGARPRPRRGVPQARHIHALLPRGRAALEELFPGLTPELVGLGVASGDLLGDSRIHLSGHRLRRARSGLIALSLSRALLESRVRERVRALPQVTFAEPCDVLGLTTTTARDRITGVRLLRRADGSAKETLPAELVVDATGRGSRTPVWLDQLGYGAVEEERITVDLGYATAVYDLPPDVLDGDWGILQGPTPDHARGAALGRLEDGQWMLTLFGLLGDHPPTDLGGFLDFARSLGSADVYHAIRDHEPLGEPVPFRFPANVRRRFERLADLPEGLFPVGDSICSFNPIYGQGMTVAALEALELRRHLRRRRPPSSRRFLRDISRFLDAPWEMAVGADLALPDVEGPRTHKVRALNGYVPRLHAAASRDAELATAFVRVMGMVDHPRALLRPRVLRRVITGRGHGHLARRRPASTEAGSTREMERTPRNPTEVSP
jgi:2-polyprenyl-6-methoxyphenol hydroxylase-like FAD-dependent oxidoreductase